MIDLYNFYAELEKGSAKKSAAAKNDEDVEECLFFIGMKNAVPDVVATLVGLDAYSVEMRENAAATADPDAVGDVDDVVVGCAAPTGFVYIETLRIASTGVTLFFDATPESSSGSGGGSGGSDEDGTISTSKLLGPVLAGLVGTVSHMEPKLNFTTVERSNVYRPLSYIMVNSVVMGHFVPQVLRQLAACIFSFQARRCAPSTHSARTQEAPLSTECRSFYSSLYTNSNKRSFTK